MARYEEIASLQSALDRATEAEKERKVCPLPTTGGPFGELSPLFPLKTPHPLFLVTRQLTSLDRTPPSAKHQPLPAMREPLSAMPQPPSVAHQPPPVDRQPPSGNHRPWPPR